LVKAPLGLTSTISVLASGKLASTPAVIALFDRTASVGRLLEDVMRLELRYRSDIDLSQPAMQVEIRSHIARCLRDYPQGGEGVITLGGVEHCFMYVVQDDVVDTVIGPPDYIEQVLNERQQNTPEARTPLPRKEHN
jgi:hypothetical protein